LRIAAGMNFAARNYQYAETILAIFGKTLLKQILKN
jgi:hypothetical protein